MIGNGIFNLPGTYGYGPERNFGRGSPACSPTTPALPAFAAHTTCDPGEAARLRARRIPGARKHLASGRTPVRAILVGRCASPPRSASPTTEPRTCPWRDTPNPHRATSEAPSASGAEPGEVRKTEGPTRKRTLRYRFVISIDAIPRLRPTCFGRRPTWVVREPVRTHGPPVAGACGGTCGLKRPPGSAIRTTHPVIGIARDTRPLPCEAEVRRPADTLKPATKDSLGPEEPDQRPAHSGAIARGVSYTGLSSCAFVIRSRLLRSSIIVSIRSETAMTSERLRHSAPYLKAVKGLREDLDALPTRFRYPTPDERKQVRTANAIERRFREARQRIRPMERVLFAILPHQNKNE